MEFNCVPDSGDWSVRIKKSTTFILMVLLGVFAFNPTWAFTAPIDSKTVSKSETTARNAALANLRKKILALKLTPSLTVADFADTNQEVHEAVSRWLASIKKRGKVIAADNEVVTVTVAVSMKAIQIRLTDIYASYYDGKKIEPRDINNIAETNNSREVQATGSSTPDKKDAIPPAGKKSLDVPTPIPTTTPTVASDTKTPVVGLSEDCWKHDLIPQHARRAELMAELAAKQNALYRLGQRLRDVKIGHKLTVNDFIVNSDQPDVDMSEFMRAAARTQITLRGDMLVCEIQMQAELKPAIAILKSWADENYKGDQKHIQLLRDYVEKQKPETITEIGIGIVEPKYVKERFVNQQKQLTKIASKPPQWISETIQVTGEAIINVDDKGNGEKKPLAVAKNDAIAAAKADAEKKLMAMLMGLELPAKSSIRDLAAKSPEFMEKLESIENLEKRVQLVDDPQLEKDKIVRVTISIKLKPLWDWVLFNQVYRSCAPKISPSDTE